MAQANGCTCGRRIDPNCPAAKPDTYYVGNRESMIAEVAAFEGVDGKYLATWSDPAGHQWDTEGYDTLKDLRAAAALEREKGREIVWY